MIVVAIAGLLLPVTASAASVNDDFNDNMIGSQWTQIIDDSTTLNLKEQNSRLEAIANAPASPNADAIYLSNFRLSTASNFDMTIQYSFNSYQQPSGPLNTALGLVFGVGQDTDGKNSAAIGQGFGTVTTTVFGQPVTATAPAVTVGYRIDDAPAGPDPVPSFNTNGTFEIIYQAATDDLTLRETATNGYSDTLHGLVAGTWHASDLLVSFGARGNGFTTASGDAYLDNFTLVSGNVTPEPACLTGIFIATSALLRRRTRSV